jgi:putative transcriptional regulator
VERKYLLLRSGSVLVSYGEPHSDMQNNIRKLRQDQNITQEELAASLGVSRQTVIAIEKGNYIPSLLLAMQLAEHFQLPIEKIFQRSNLLK